MTTTTGTITLKALFQDRVQQRFVEHIAPVLMVSSRDRVHQRLVVLFITTSSRRTRRKRWRRMMCSMSPPTASNTPPFLPRRLCNHNMAGGCERRWICKFAHGEQELHPSTLRAADRGRASTADHGCSSLVRCLGVVQEVQELVSSGRRLRVCFRILYFGLVRQRTQFMRQSLEASVFLHTFYVLADLGS